MRKLGFVRRLETLKQDTKMNIRHLTIAILATSSSLIMPVAAQPPDMSYWLGRKYGILEKQVDGEYKRDAAEADRVNSNKAPPSVQTKGAAPKAAGSRIWPPAPLAHPSN
jgi:hypothetical protein